MAASEAAFVALKVAGAVVLVWLGVQALRRAGAAVPDFARQKRARSRSWYRQGLVTSLANPELAVFFIALFPQFVPAGAPVLLPTLTMALIIALMDLAWFTLLAVVVSRAQSTIVDRGWARRLEALGGGVLMALGVRLALTRP